MKQSFTEVTFTLQLSELYTCPTLLGSLQKKKVMVWVKIQQNTSGRHELLPNHVWAHSLRRVICGSLVRAAALPHPKESAEVVLAY